MNLENYFHKKRDAVNSQLNEIITPQITPCHSLFEAAKYSINSSGKRLRPILTLAVAETLQGDGKLALKPACAIEMIHTYSMIHDDLPCMDDDDFRRGKPTLHKVFSEGIAVLAGDFLLTHAFQVILESPGLNDSQKLDLISVLTKSSGGKGMIAGQVMDIEAEEKEISYEALKTIHKKKTGALITASIEFGAIISNATHEERQLFKQFGDRIGLAFQVIDDVLDVTQSELKHGKKTSSDTENKKSTYVSHFGIEKAKDYAHELIVEGNQKLASLPYDTSVLQDIANYTISRKI